MASIHSICISAFFEVGVGSGYVRYATSIIMNARIIRVQRVRVHDFLLVSPSISAPISLIPFLFTTCGNYTQLAPVWPLKQVANHQNVCIVGQGGYCELHHPPGCPGSCDRQPEPHDQVGAYVRTLSSVKLAERSFICRVLTAGLCMSQRTDTGTGRRAAVCGASRPTRPRCSPWSTTGPSPTLHTNTHMLTQHAQVHRSYGCCVAV